MVVLPCLAVGFMMNLVAVLFVLSAVTLILIVLIQKGRGGGLSGALGGAGAGGVLGSKTGDFLTWVTIGAVSVFLLMAVLMAMYYRPAAPGDGVTQVPPPVAQSENVAPPSISVPNEPNDSSMMTMPPSLGSESDLIEEVNQAATDAASTPENSLPTGVGQ